MDIDVELLKLQCIKNMGPDYTKKWEQIKNVYAPELDTGSIYNPVAYTLHDYSHHCYDIYKIISQVILYPEKDDFLSQQDWFVLNVAVLLHDYSMTFPNFDRLIHSRQSAEWLIKQSESEDDTVIKANLSHNEPEIISLIIRAHSDCKIVKNGKEIVSEYNLENPDLLDEMDGGGADFIHAKFLAVVLRLADECDVTHSRANKNNKSSYLDDENTEQRISKEHWLKLQCFKSIKRGNNKLELIVNDSYLQKISGDIDNSQKRIISVVKTIRKQIKYVREKVIANDDRYLQHFPVDEVIIESTYLDKSFVEEVNKNQFEQDISFCPEINLLDMQLSEELKKVGIENMEVPGHYIVSDEYCARDWIELQNIVADNQLVQKIAQYMVKDIINSHLLDKKQKVIFVATESNGVILAAPIAYQLKQPFTYLVPYNRNMKKCSEQEKKVDLSKYDNIILFTDAIATFRSLGNTIRGYGITNKICKIYAILYRKPQEVKYLDEDAAYLASKLSVCYNGPSLEIHMRKKCQREKCVAENL